MTRRLYHRRAASWPACLECGAPAPPGPRGGFRPRCPVCQAARDNAPRWTIRPATKPAYNAERARQARLARGQPAVRLCQRCGAPARSPRSWYCAACRAWADENGRRRSAERRHPKTRQERGYGASHDAARKRWAPQVERGGVACGRCHQLIEPGSQWDLGHPNDDKSLPPVPWHQRCNRQYAVTVTKRRRMVEP